MHKQKNSSVTKAGITLLVVAVPLGGYKFAKFCRKQAGSFPSNLARVEAMKVEEFVWMVKYSELQHSLLPEDCFINTFNLPTS